MTEWEPVGVVKTQRVQKRGGPTREEVVVLEWNRETGEYRRERVE